MAKAKKAPANGVDFERSMNELEQLVVGLEQGEMSLEQSLEAFERGIQLTRECRDALAQAEQKVEILVGKGADESMEPFERDA